MKAFPVPDLRCGAAAFRRQRGGSFMSQPAYEKI